MWEQWEIAFAQQTDFAYNLAWDAGGVSPAGPLCAHGNNRQVCPMRKGHTFYMFVSTCVDCDMRHSGLVPSCLFSH